jgi:hypothetical protein
MHFLSRISLSLLIVTIMALPLPAEESSLDKFAALAAAEQFLLLLDRGNLEKSWESTSKLFKDAAIKLQWVERVGHLRDQYGAYQNRQLRYSKAMQNVEGAPEGEYYFLIYGSNFANKESVIETITIMKESDGLWRVSGYTIE